MNNVVLSASIFVLFFLIFSGSVVLSQDSLSDGLSYVFIKGESEFFSLKENIVKFTLKDIGFRGNYAIFLLDDNNYEIYANEGIFIDLDIDGNNDLFVRAESIRPDSATIFIKEINRIRAHNKSEINTRGYLTGRAIDNNFKQRSFFLCIFILIILICVVAFLILYYDERNKRITQLQNEE